MHQIYNSDKPILLKKFDRFNRYKFSNRIANTIKLRTTADGLVIGIYGIWGEGKTSVLNMIEEDLLTSNDVLIVKFNPWRFKDEDTLIINYFKSISLALDKELYNKKEKLGQFLTKYGNIGSVINLDLSKVGESISDLEVEQLKQRVNDFLVESKKKVVVFIDDIDRLDKQELFALFKLIKLTGDFFYTYYILSFDDEMVASAIGEKYEEGNKNSGHNFLEKIIQVPLRIPQALTSNLQDFTFEIINNVLREHNIDFNNETSLLSYQISQNILLKINTPRLAIRFGNSLSFLIPLLKGEVNIADLILFEAVKLFYNDHYNFIRKHPEFFVEPYNDSGTPNQNKKEQFKLQLNSLNQDLPKKEEIAILSLLKHLFPIIKEPLENYSYAYGNQNWEKGKKIGSYKYFNRYLLYSVPKNDISDIYFVEYLKGLTQKETNIIEQETSELLNEINPNDFFSKIEIYKAELDWHQIEVLINIIYKVQLKFENKHNIKSINLFNHQTQAAITVIKLLQRQLNLSIRTKILLKLFNELDFNFSFEIIYWLNLNVDELGFTINKKDINRLENILLNKAIKDSDEIHSNIFIDYPNYIFRLLEIFYQQSPVQLNKYFEKCNKKFTKFHELLIEQLSTTVLSSAYTEPYKTDFKKNSYDLLKKYYDVNKLYKFFQKREYAKVRRMQIKFLDSELGYSKENAIRQFIHWYELDNKIGDYIDPNKVIVVS